LAFTDDAVVINNFSKYYCMTGWRIGSIVLPSEIVRKVECLSQNVALSVNAISQHAGIGAFDATDELETVKEGEQNGQSVLPVAAGYRLLQNQIVRVGGSIRSPATTSHDISYAKLRFCAIWHARW
jgi:aspartate/methionine/tyrosine aminotransferase